MPEPITRTVLETFDVPDSAYLTVIMRVVLAPNTPIGLHTHPGCDAAYVLDGDLVVLERGQPEKPIRAGQSSHVRPGIMHEVRSGDRPT